MTGVIDLKNGSSESPFGKVAVVWENVLMISIVYNFVTCCYFLGLPGFPS
jgi:hypothetical protein